jgi:hypothetical protein
MNTAIALAGLLAYAILTIWVRETWAWAAFQAGLFALAAFWTARALARNRRLHGSLLLLPFAGVLLWGGWQIVAGQTI